MLFILHFLVALFAYTMPAHADPISAIASFFVSTFGVGAATAVALAQVSFGLGLNILLSVVARAAVERPKLELQFNVAFGDDTPLDFTVGKYALAGKLKYVGSWGKNRRFVTEVYEISALPQGLAGLWVNDQPGDFVTGRSGYVTAGSPGSRSQIAEASTVPGGGILVGTPMNNNRDDGDTNDPRIWVKWHSGSQAAADPLMLWAFGNDESYPYNANMIGTGKSYVVVTFQHDKDTQTGRPKFLFEPAPLPMYDPRKDSTAGGSGAHRWGNRATYEPSLNNAVVAYNIARGIYFGSEWVFGGKNLPAWRLPVAEWMAAMNACDRTVSLAGGGTEPSYRCGAHTGLRCREPSHPPRARTSGENLSVVLLMMLYIAQELEPPENPGWVSGATGATMTNLSNRAAFRSNERSAPENRRANSYEKRDVTSVNEPFILFSIAGPGSLS